VIALATDAHRLASRLAEGGARTFVVTIGSTAEEAA
jgi:hypothetical protein